MSFPASPTNGEVTIINGVIYVYNDANGSWDRVSSGTILPANIANGNSNVRISANSNVTVSVAGTANVLTVTATSANISGNLSVTGDAVINDITATGNITAVNVSASSNMAAGNISATGIISATGNISSSGNLIINGNANITGNILSASFQNGNSSVNIAANANVTITSKSNATVVVTDTGANISGTANISGNANVGNLGTTGLLTASGNVTGGNLVATNNIQINGNQIKSSTGNVAITLDDIDVTIAGNLIVSGSSTTINTATLDVEDLNITVAKGAASAAAANGAGITVDGAAASLIYNNTSNTWVFDRGANVSGTLNATGNANVANIGTGLVLATSNIVAGSSSGSANYYNIGSVGRAMTVIAAANTAVIESVGAAGNGGAIFLGNVTSRQALIQSSSDNTLTFWTSYAGLGNAVSLAMTINNIGAVSMTNNLSVAGNISSSAAITSTGNVAAGNLTTAGALSVTGNANTGNLGTTTVIATTANLTTINSGKMQSGNSNIVITPNGNVTVTSTSNATMIVTGTGVNIAGTANITSTLTTVGDIVVSSGNAATSITTGALRVTGGIGTQGNLFVGGNLTTSNAVSVTYTPASATGVAITTTGKDTVGSTGYFDFLRATNTTSGVTNGSKTLRLNNVGTLEVLNSAYNATVLSVTDAGFIAINQSSGATNGVPVNNGIAMGNNSYIFDDGNYHITAKTGTIWLNSNDGNPVNINTQMPGGITGGGLNVQGAVKSYGSGAAATAFISSGSNVVSGVALQLDSGTAGTPAQMAIRDTSTVSSTMYFDVSTGGSAHGSFQFRSSNAFSQLLALSNSTITVNRQMLIGGGSQGGYVTITGTNSYNLGGPYGYLNSGGAGTVGGGGSSGTVGWSLQCIGRIQVSEIDATSDERLKDIQGTIPLDRALQFVRAVDGILYTWKPGFGDEGLKSGFGAQSVHKAGFDHMVTPIPNERVEGSTDADGFTSPDKAQLTLNYQEAIPYHHEVIKNLLERIEKLEAKIAELSNGK